MTVPIKGPLRRRYDKVADVVLLHYGTDVEDNMVPATIVWWTKARGQVVRDGTVLKQFESQKELVTWMEKVSATFNLQDN